MKVLFREHKGGLDESMKTLREFDSDEDMKIYVKETLGINLEIELVTYSPLPDKRIGWSHTNAVNIITDQGKSIYGFYTSS